MTIRVWCARRNNLSAVEAGKRPNRCEFAARYAELFPALATYLDAVDLLHGTAPQTPPTSQPEPAMEAAVLGDFRIEREIGRGGMGVVYEAVQLSLGGAWR